MSRRKWVSYIGIFGLILVVLVGALVANMKALAINRERQVILREVRQLEKENRVLELEVVSANRLANIERVAKERLGMSEPGKVRFLVSK